MNYRHLTRKERYQIYALKKAGHTQKEIADVLERCPSIISLELARSHGRRGYCPKQARQFDTKLGTTGTVPGFQDATAAANCARLEPHCSNLELRFRACIEEHALRFPLIATPPLFQPHFA